MVDFNFMKVFEGVATYEPPEYVLIAEDRAEDDGDSDCEEDRV